MPPANFAAAGAALIMSELPSTPRGAIFLRPSRERDRAPRPPLTHASGARLDADELGKDRARARAWFRTRSPVARADDERGGSEEAEEEHAILSSAPHHVRRVQVPRGAPPGAGARGGPKGAPSSDAIAPPETPVSFPRDASRSRDVAPNPPFARPVLAAVSFI